MIEPADARDEYVNLMRWRLEQVLGYRWTHQLEIRNTRDLPIYHLIFATDSKAGHDIMSYLYDQAAAEFPAMAREARTLRDPLKREAQGQFDLLNRRSSVRVCGPVFSPDRSERQRLYIHEPPDEPRAHDVSTCPYCN